MNKQQLIQWLLLNDYHLEDGQYVFTYNAVRHWASIKDNSIRMYSIYEGTAGDEPIFDTGYVINPDAEFLNKMLSKSKELRWNG
jgi:hypothetical protein